MQAARLICLALLLGAALCLPAPAQAYTVHNKLAYEACIIDAGIPTTCAFTVPAGGTRASDQGFPTQVWFNYNPKPGVCYLSQQIATIPEGGAVDIYPDKAQIYYSGGKLKETVGIALRPCASRTGK